MTNRFRPLPAIATAFPLAIIARSTTFQLTIKALEFGKSFLILGGRPISRAFLKSAFETFLFAMAFSPFIGLSFTSLLNLNLSLNLSLFLLRSGQYLPPISLNLHRELFVGDVSQAGFQESGFPFH